MAGGGCRVFVTATSDSAAAAQGHDIDCRLAESLRGQVKLVVGDRVHVIERGAGGGANPAAQQREFAEKTAPPDVRQDQVSTGMGLGDFDEADSHQEETVGRLSLAFAPIIVRYAEAMMQTLGR